MEISNISKMQDQTPYCTSFLKHNWAKGDEATWHPRLHN